MAILGDTGMITGTSTIISGVPVHYVYILIGCLVLGFVYYAYSEFYLKKKRKKLFYILYIKGKNDVELLKRYDTNLSLVKINKKIYNLKETVPKFLATKKGRVPLFLAEKDLLIGLDFKIKGEVVSIDKKGVETKIQMSEIEAKFRPDVVYSMMESKVLKEFANSNTGASFNWMTFIAGLGAGVGLYIILQGFGLF